MSVGQTAFSPISIVNIFTSTKTFTIVIREWKNTLLKNVNNCLNTNICSCSETSGGQNSNLYLNVVHFFNTSVAALDSCFPALVSIMCYSIAATKCFVIMNPEGQSHKFF